jgi:tRNA(Phe) wybutosine-synthesizing methylase Tyw3
MEETNKSKVEWWELRKKEILNGIHEAIEQGSPNTEVLEIMKELVQNARARNSIINYYEKFEEE